VCACGDGRRGDGIGRRRRRGVQREYRIWAGWGGVALALVLAFDFGGGNG
jgi:hypothetical protein